MNTSKLSASISAAALSRMLRLARLLFPQLERIGPREARSFQDELA